MSKKIRRIKNNKLLVVVCVAVVAIVGFALWNFVQVRLDARKFADMSKNKDVVISDLIGHLGNNVHSVVNQDICFNTEQGPFDNGKLWCQVATVVSLKDEVSFDELGEEFLSAVESNGLSAYSRTDLKSDSQTFAFSVGGGRWCELGYSSRSERGTSGTRDVLFGVDPPALAVACADRARAKHYPYAD